MSRAILSECGSPLVISMNVATGWTDAAIGEMCTLDATADFTVKDNVADTVPLGRIVSLRGTAGTDQIAGVEIFGGYNAVRSFTTTAAAITIGHGLQVAANGGQAVETTGSAAAVGQPMALNAIAGTAAATVYALV